ncbi:unnamed protein product [Parnassius apollo]|uniref:(apollo) hypothetical protein n=1 Tax=Parnassius apollo TaxID=110799 RepID=A0A8S3YAZ0_PARAO|nr:unnamed protein product [Parnassius apollo]
MIGKLVFLATLVLAQGKPQVENEYDGNEKSVRYELCPEEYKHYLLPHEYDCTKFYYCEYGMKWELPRDCSPGTEFSFELQVCIHPTLANCTLPGTSTDSDEDLLENGCPADFDVHKLLPHETKCNKFYYCVHGQKVERQCAPGTYFNAELQVCDWPENVDCSNFESGEDEEDCENNDTDGGGILPNGCPADFDIHKLLPHESDCSKFYYCVFGEKVERSCAPGTLFNPELQVCDWPINVNCTTNGNPPDTDSGEGSGDPDMDTDGMLPNDCPSDFDEHKLLPHETECNKFYQCVFGEKVERECAPGTYFNPELEVCDWPHNVECAGSVGGDGGSGGAGGEDLPNGCPADFDIHKLLPHETNCSKFYFCVFGEKVERECPSNTHFNPTLQVCDWPENAGCANNDGGIESGGGGDEGNGGDGSGEGGSCGDGSGGQGICGGEGSGEGGSVEGEGGEGESGGGESCGGGSGDCGTDGNGDENGNGEGGLLPNGCPSDFDIHKLLPHETDCDKFYYCVLGEKVERTCAPGTHFNPMLQVCDWPENAGCATNGGGDGGSGEGADGDGGNGEGGSGDGESESGDGENKNKCEDGCNILPWPHENDCDKFWRCDGSTAVLVVCSEGLHFNPKTLTCDFICNVSCSRRDVESTVLADGLKVFLPWDKINPRLAQMYLNNNMNL